MIDEALMPPGTLVHGITYGAFVRKQPYGLTPDVVAAMRPRIGKVIDHWWNGNLRLTTIDEGDGKLVFLATETVRPVES